MLILSQILDLVYGATPTPTFQLPDGRLQPDFLMDTFPNALFFLISFAASAAVCYSNTIFYETDLEKQNSMMIACVIPLAVHWGLFLGHALPQKSEKYFDLAGQLGMCAMLAFAFATRKNFTSRSILVSVLVATWSLRLGYFLFTRMLERGEDWRFVRARVHPGYHFFAWTSQGLWCFFQGQAVLALLGKDTHHGELTALDLLGAGVWALGLFVEHTADAQKLDFVRRFPKRETRLWIQEGLWRYSRHPNFAGETTCWIGISIICWTGLVLVAGAGNNVGEWEQGWKQIIFAPVFSMLFLQQTTVPWLDLLADAKYAGKPGYKEYCATTSKYWLLPNRREWFGDH